jgi:hypothetical protein
VAEEFSVRVQTALRDALAARTDREWTTERYVRRTPVDVATDDGATPLVLVEVELRRADPANNPVKVARAVHEGAFDRPVRLVQLFSGYYDLDGGGVSSKRENATFVGSLADEALAEFTYGALDLGFTPPVRGAEPPAGWREAVVAAAACL